jgi:hypothetical protein
MKHLRKNSDYTGEAFSNQTEDESYRRYKHIYYRNLILEALLGFLLGLVVACVRNL